MRLTIAGLVLVVLTATVAPAQTLPATETGKSRHAIATRPLHLYLEGGVTAPLELGRFDGPSYSNAQFGLAVRASIALRLTEWLSVGPDVFYSRHGMNLTSERYDAGTTRILTGGVTWRYAISMLMPESRANTRGEQLTAYVFSLSAGYATVESDEFQDMGFQDYPSLSSKGQWLLGAGFGVEREFTDRFVLSIGLRWMYVFEEDLHIAPLTIGVKI